MFSFPFSHWTKYEPTTFRLTFFSFEKIHITFIFYVWRQILCPKYPGFYSSFFVCFEWTVFTANKIFLISNINNLSIDRFIYWKQKLEYNRIILYWRNWNELNTHIQLWTNLTNLIVAKKKLLKYRSTIITKTNLNC